MTKRNIKKINISIIFITLFIIICISFIMKNILKYPLGEKKLKEIGYAENEIELIMHDDSYLHYALNHYYDDNFINLLKVEEFKIEYFESYINYMKNNNRAPVSDVVYLINNDINYEYSKTLMDFTEAKYFLKTRIERYMKYYEKNTSLSINEIIKRVNSDIDYGFYTNIENTDTSYGILLICNKHYKLSSSYKGNLVYMSGTYTRVGGAQLDSTAYEAFKKLSDAARSKGLNIVNQSAYRSYNTQYSIYNSYLANKGQTWTDKWSARPGHSEHQTGLALDVATYTTKALGDFAYTNEFTWMKDNAHKYGFILRYPNGQEYITGYGYEPWHYRYVGVDAATTIYNENITYEEYFAYYVLKK